VACFVAGAAPLVIVQLALLSALLARQPFPLVGETGYLHLFESRWLDALFSSRHGFFSWTPIAYVAAIGTVCYLRHDRVWASCAIFVLAAMSWVNGSADDWWGGWAFGGRRFTSSLSALGPGLALAVAWTKARPMLALAPLVVAAAGWNVMLMQQYHHERIPRDAAISFKTIVRQQGDLLTEQMEVYPFAFPANVWFAWRERLPVDRYDLLAPEPLEPRIHLRLGPNQARFLLDGWEQLSSHQDDGQPVVATGESARLAVPLDPPRAPPLALEVDASTRPSRHPIRVRVAVAVNGQVVGTVEVEPDRRTFLFAGGEASSRAVWRRGYNHLTFRKLSAHVRGDDGTWRSATDRPGNWPVAVYEVRIDPRPAGFTR
jgi:hypothetical protein